MSKAMRRSLGLSRAEAELWQAWKRAADSVLTQVEREVSRTTGLSAADYSVLSRLVELGQGRLRQQELCDSMAWQKSRLSHQLSRMQQRALLRRERADGTGVTVVVTAAGKRALEKALPAQANAVRAQLLTKVPRAERAQLLSLLARLSAD